MTPAKRRVLILGESSLFNRASFARSLDLGCAPLENVVEHLIIPAARMTTSRKYTLAEFTRLMESTGAAKSGEFQASNRPLLPDSGTELPEDGFANRVVS